MQKAIEKKEEEEKKESEEGVKEGQVSQQLKQWVLDARFPK